MDKKTLKLDFHVHTSDDVFDNIPHGPEQLVDEMVRMGFDGFAVTNHDHHVISDRLSGYARERGLLIIPGMELTYLRQHIVLLNFREPGKVKTPADIMRDKGEANLVMAAHPYFPWAPSCGKLLDARPELFDAIEFCHLYNGVINFNRKAVLKAEELGLPLLGTSDAHTLFQIGYTYTVVDAEKDTESVIAAIKAGRSGLFTSPFNLLDFAKVLAYMRLEDLKRAFGRKHT